MGCNGISLLFSMTRKQCLCHLRNRHGALRLQYQYKVCLGLLGKRPKEHILKTKSTIERKLQEAKAFLSDVRINMLSLRFAHGNQESDYFVSYKLLFQWFDLRIWFDYTVYKKSITPNLLSGRKMSNFLLCTAFAFQSWAVIVIAEGRRRIIHIPIHHKARQSWQDNPTQRRTIRHR